MDPRPQLLSALAVVVDGRGAPAARVAASLRAVGVGRVAHGTYAAEPALWSAHPWAGVVFVRNRALDPSVAEPWRRGGVLHLPVRVDAEGAEVGPLVLPGRTSCARCHAMVRALSARTPREVPATAPSGTSPRPADPATIELAAAIAALTVRQALLGDHDLAGVSSEFRSGRPEVVHRHWPRQLDCSCGDRARAPWAAHATMGA